LLLPPLSLTPDSMAELETAQTQVTQRKPPPPEWETDVTEQKDYGRALSGTSSDEKQVDARAIEEATPHGEDDAEKSKAQGWYQKYRIFILCGWIVIVLGWWISSMIVPGSRHRWVSDIACISSFSVSDSPYFFVRSPKHSGHGPLACERRHRVPSLFISW
jgi:hypothetical protein